MTPPHCDLGRRLFCRWGALLAVPAAGCQTAGRIDMQPWPGAIPVPAWGGTATAVPPVAQAITHITIHHQGEIWAAEADVPTYLVRLQNWSRKAKGWVDIPYHLVIAPNGQVYAARPWQIAGDTNTDYDPRGHLLVMLLGNFEVQHPSPEQWASAVRVIAGLQRAFGLAADRIGTHRDHTAQTVCPGAHLFERIPELKAAVKALRS